MDIKKILDRVVEIYKCVALTIIALTLILIFLKIPTTITFKDIRNKRVQVQDVPLVRVVGGDLDVEITNTPIEVEGTVTIE